MNVKDIINLRFNTGLIFRLVSSYSGKTLYKSGSFGNKNKNLEKWLDFEVVGLRTLIDIYENTARSYLEISVSSYPI